MIENATAILENLQSANNSGKENSEILNIDEAKTSVEHLQYISKSLDSIERNLSYQTNIMYIDTFILSALIFFNILYKAFKIFI